MYLVRISISIAWYGGEQNDFHKFSIALEHQQDKQRKHFPFFLALIKEEEVYFLVLRIYSMLDRAFGK